MCYDPELKKDLARVNPSKLIFLAAAYEIYADRLRAFAACRRRAIKARSN